MGAGGDAGDRFDGDTRNRVGVAGDRAVRDALVAPGHQPDLVVRRTAAADDGSQYRLRAEHALDAAQGAVGAFPVGAGVAPQARLQSEMDQHPVGRQSQPDQPRRRPGRGAAAGAGQPAVELPADPFGDGRGGEQAVMPPHPVQFLTVGGDRFDAEPGTGQPVRGESLVQAFGQDPAREGGHVDPFERVVVGFADVEIRRWPTHREQPMVEPGGEPMGECPVEAEPRQHIGSRQCREIPERLDPQPAQQIGEDGPLHRIDRHGGQELPGLSGGHDLPGPGRQPRREHPVGDPDLTLHRARLRHLLDDPLGGGLLTAEIPDRPTGGDRAGTDPDHLDPDGDLLDRGDDRLEGPRVPARIMVDDHHLRAPALRLPPP
ncbi:MAG: hypothetical protein QOE51_3665 [Actinoplanes sp.]|nr:hypothetical protein [Actinoplanes sp.]